MAGVGLVGFSGSLIKDAIKNTPLPSLSGPHAIGQPPQTLTEEPQVSQVLVGEFSSRLLPLVPSHSRENFKASFSSYLLRSCLQSHFPPINWSLIRVLSISTATQFVVEGNYVTQLLPLVLLTYYLIQRKSWV